MATEPTAEYRLPEDLGGGTCVLVDQSVLNNYPAVKVLTDKGRCLIVQLSDLTPIPAKRRPEEPPVNSVVTVLDLTTGIQRVFMRERLQADGWVTMAEDEWYTWAAINEIDGDPILLVPDPFADAPELPYRINGSLIDVKVFIDSRGEVWVQVMNGTTTMTGKMDRDMGLAIVAACDKFERDNQRIGVRRPPRRQP